MTTATANTLTCGFVIRTAFIGPTEHKASRVTARFARDNETTYRVYVEWDHSLNAEKNHMRAAQTLLNKISTKRADYFESIGAPRAEAGTFEITGAGWDADHYYFLAAQL